MHDTPGAAPGWKLRVVFDQAAAQYQKAIDADATDAKSLVGLAESWTTLWCYGFIPREEAMAKARPAAKRALEMDGDLASAHTMKGWLTFCDWDWAGAELEFRRGVELAPESGAARHWLALFLTTMGRHREAQTESRRSFALDRLYQLGFGSVLYFGREFEEMAEVMEDMVKREPDSAPAHDWLGMAYVQLGRFDESIAVYRRAVELSGGLAEIRAGLGHAYGMAGLREEARRELDILERQAREGYVPPVQIAFVRVGLGDHDGAIQLLERAYQEKSWEMAFAKEEPWLEPLHGDARFHRVLDRLHFPQRTKG